MLPLRSARYLAHACLIEAVRPGDHVVDATMGNGHDTLLLAQLVGESGQVDAFDIQSGALINTRERLEAAGCEAWARLHAMGHERMAKVITQPVRAVMFNLGWLPGGDKAVTTRVETTLEAINAALALLEPGGIVTICAYPGHPEGEKEAAYVRELLAGLQPQAYNVLEQAFLNAGLGAPVCFVAQRQGMA